MKNKLRHIPIADIRNLVNVWGENVQRFLSTEDILNLAKRQANVLRYRDLQGANYLEEILEPYGACLILYEAAENVGHWVCMLVDKNGDIEFFDPYGFAPDQQLHYLPEPFRSMPRYLSRLIRDAQQRGKTVRYNNIQFQTRNAPDVSTCGRWVGARLFFKNQLSLHDFKKTFLKEQPKVSDYVITYFTNKVLGK